MNSIEDYQNIIELLKKILAFYADSNNYINTENIIAPITIDNGFQARFALDKIEELEKINQDILNDYNKYVEYYSNNSEANFNNINSFDISNLTEKNENFNIKQ